MRQQQFQWSLVWVFAGYWNLNYSKERQTLLHHRFSRLRRRADYENL